MKYSVRSLLILLAAIAIFCAFVLPNFYPARKYRLENSYVGQMSGWQYGTVNSSMIFRGDDLPTIILGSAFSDYVNELDGSNIPFAIILENENEQLWHIKTSTKFETDDGPCSITLITNNNLQLEVKYVLFAENTDEPGTVVEKISVNDVPYELTNGRLFTIRSCKFVTQESLAEISRELIPEYVEGDETTFAELIDWWQTIRERYSINAE